MNALRIRTDDYYAQANQDLQRFAAERSVSLLVRGSNAVVATKIPHWSDIDATLMVERCDADVLKICADIHTLFREKYPDIPLHLTITERADSPMTNPLHHHGAKPLAYGYEVALHSSQALFRMPALSDDAIRLSSVYRYHEVLHGFRRSFVNAHGKLRDQALAKELHRLLRLFRTQLEIMKPWLVRELGKIPEQEFTDIIPWQGAAAFFRLYERTRQDWHRIRRDDNEQDRLSDALADGFSAAHAAFLPILSHIGKRYLR